MSDPFSWSFPIGRLFGITIRVHILFPLVVLGMVLYVAFHRNPHVAAYWPVTCLLLLLLFVSVLLHELGHCFGARLVEGDAHEVLLWPLGGLAAIEVPHTPRANFIATAAGPAVNLLLCLATGAALLSAALVPPLEPWSAPLRPKLYSWAEGSYFYTDAGQPVDELYADAYEKFLAGKLEDKDLQKLLGEKTPPAAEGRLLSPTQVFLARFFWLNWFLFLLNLLPGFPLDGGRMLQYALWARTDFRRATLVAISAGFITMFVVAIYSMVVGSIMIFSLALFIYITCRHQWIVLETGGEEPLFGYDFSQGYTSLERDQPPTAPPRRRPNFIQRWLQRRAARKLQREQEQRETEERRMDELLEKVQQHGLQALTDEERRFLTRVSARYRNRH